MLLALELHLLICVCRIILLVNFGSHCDNNDNNIADGKWEGFKKKRINFLWFLKISKQVQWGENIEFCTSSGKIINREGNLVVTVPTRGVWYSCCQWGLLMKALQPQWGLLMEALQAKWGWLMEALQAQQGLLMEALQAQRGLLMEALQAHWG